MFCEFTSAARYGEREVGSAHNSKRVIEAQQATVEEKIAPRGPVNFALLWSKRLSLP